MKFLNKVFLLLLFLSTLSLVQLKKRRHGTEHEDTIRDLPGLTFSPNFEHYSGFLQGSPTHFLHYWFVTSQGQPSRDPLVFWFNGGPGCSSMEGLLNEMGPYQINPDGATLRQNPDSWNKYASVVYIEAPAGVGYSYATNGNTTTDDDQTAEENYAAIQHFFSKFPEFRENPVYITGESYGGVYVPTLTAKIVEGLEEFPVNLKGMAIGNGYVNADLNVDTSVRFAYGHGLIDEKVWNTLEMQCCHGCIDGCDLTAFSGSCEKLVDEINDLMWYGGLNPYDLYRDCDPSPVRNSFRLSAYRAGLLHTQLFRKLNRVRPPLATWLMSNVANNSNENPAPGVPCMNDTAITTYMNSQNVRKAINIPENATHWDICSEEITETYKKTYGDVSPFIKRILAAHVRVLLFYGDTDMACNFIMGQQFSARLGLKRVLGKTPWKYGHQIAGFKTLYSKGFTFLTVRGAGHMAPQWKAPQMDYVLQQFLLNQPI